MGPRWRGSRAEMGGQKAGRSFHGRHGGLLLPKFADGGVSGGFGLEEGVRLRGEPSPELNDSGGWSSSFESKLELFELFQTDPHQANDRWFSVVFALGTSGLLRGDSLGLGMRERVL